ncbi:MAG: rhombosortase [Polyangiaceae bacterium]
MITSQAEGSDWTTTLLRRGPWLTALLTTLACLAGASPRLQFDRDAVWAGEWWRVLSAHFVHYGSAHAIGDIVAFFGWGLVIEAVSRRLFATTTFVACFVVGLGVLSLCPEAQYYAGLSAIDVALATVLLLVLWMSPRVREIPGARFAVGLFAAGHVLKTLYELRTGMAILAPDLGVDVRLLPAAHLFGALAGAAVFVVHRAGERRRR